MDWIELLKIIIPLIVGAIGGLLLNLSTNKKERKKEIQQQQAKLKGLIPCYIAFIGHYWIQQKESAYHFQRYLLLKNIKKGLSVVEFQKHMNSNNYVNSYIIQLTNLQQELIKCISILGRLKDVQVDAIINSIIEDFDKKANFQIQIDNFFKANCEKELIAADEEFGDLFGEKSKDYEDSINV